MKMIGKIDAKYRIFVFGGIIIVLFVLVIAVASIFTNTKHSYANIEQKMKNAAQSYYKDRGQLLPTEDGSKVTITVEQLVEAEKIKSLEKLKKGETCTGSVTVMNNNGYYLYLPYLDCGENYKTKTLVSTITDSSKIVSSGNGLYQVNDEYIFRGEYVDNYVTFAGEPWRIIKVNSDHSLRLIHVAKSEDVEWDNRYNSVTQDSDGINNYLVSRIRDKVVARYNDEKFFTNTDRSYIVSHDVCIGKRTANDNNAIECSNILEKQPLALPRASEIMVASIDPECTTINSMNCTNYNWMAKLQQDFWTVTADASSTNYAYRISGVSVKTKTNRSSALYVVLHLAGDITYTSGDGSSKNPYVIK